MTEYGDKDNYEILTGDAFFTPTGGTMFNLGNIVGFKCAAKVESIEHMRHERGRAVMDRTDAKSVSPEWEIECDEEVLTTAELRLFGDATEWVQDAEVGVSVEFTGVRRLRSYELGRLKVSDVVVSVGVDVMGVDVDYALDAEKGIITILSGGSIATGDDVSVVCDCAAVSRLQVVAFERLQRSGLFVLHEDAVDGLRRRLSFAADVYLQEEKDATAEEWKTWTLKVCATGPVTVLGAVTDMPAMWDFSRAEDSQYLAMI